MKIRLTIHQLSQQQVGELLSVSPRSVRDWHDCPRNPDGSYSGPAVVAWYVAKNSAGASDYDNQRERLAAAQADKVEMENAVRRGQLAELASVERVWGDFVANARAKILGIGAKLAPRLVNIGDASIISAAIRTECRAALGELGDYDPGLDPFADGDDPSRRDDGDAAAGTERKRVGRPRKAPVERVGG